MGRKGQRAAKKHRNRKPKPPVANEDSPPVESVASEDSPITDPMSKLLSLFKGNYLARFEEIHTMAQEHLDKNDGHGALKVLLDKGVIDAICPRSQPIVGPYWQAVFGLQLVKAHLLTYNVPQAYWWYELMKECWENEGVHAVDHDNAAQGEAFKASIGKRIEEAGQVFEKIAQPESQPHLRALGIHQGPVRLVRSLNVNDMRANNYVGTIVPVNGSQVCNEPAALTAAARSPRPSLPTFDNNALCSGSDSGSTSAFAQVANAFVPGLSDDSGSKLV